ncbi:MAG: hypothetical protein KAS72_07170 [Phycisphaerales bacterium]|nr:hypothetical protein [Phycisphaerales bacterium]
MNRTTSRNRNRRRLRTLLPALAVLIVPLAAADTIYFGLPLRDVTIIEIRSGEVAFMHNGSRMTRPLDQVDDILFDDLVDLTRARAACESGDFSAAANAYQAAFDAATNDTQRIWILGRLVESHGKADQPARAIRCAAEIIILDDSLFWLRMPTITDGAGAAPEHIDAARDAISRARDASDDPSTLQFLDMLGAALDRVPVDDSQEQADEQPIDEVDALLRAGNAEQALALIALRSKSADRAALPKLFFQAGTALMQLDRPAEAALSYMRCAAHFPDTSWAVRSLLATGRLYVDRFGRPSVALLLAERALESAKRLDDAELLQEAEQMVSDCHERLDGASP